jgi:hypothetical protein
MHMKLMLGSLSALVWLMAANTSLAQNKEDDLYQPWVQVRDGEISITFDQTPVPFALYAIHAQTGFQIVIPASAQTKVINLRLPRQPLEPAVRSLISNIGYHNFALMYDAAGRPNRAVVLGAQVETPKNNAPAKQAEPPVIPLTADEREKLQKDLERWAEQTEDERDRIEARLKTLPASDEREQLVEEYDRQILALQTEIVAVKN